MTKNGLIFVTGGGVGVATTRRGPLRLPFSVDAKEVFELPPVGESTAKEYVPGRVIKVVTSKVTQPLEGTPATEATWAPRAGRLFQFNVPCDQLMLVTTCTCAGILLARSLNKCSWTGMFFGTELTVNFIYVIRLVPEVPSINVVFFPVRVAGELATAYASSLA